MNTEVDTVAAEAKMQAKMQAARDAQHERYLAHRQKYIDSAKRWQTENRDRSRTIKQAYNAAHSDERNKKSAEYYAKNKEIVNLKRKIKRMLEGGATEAELVVYRAALATMLANR